MATFQKFGKDKIDCNINYLQLRISPVIRFGNLNMNRAEVMKM